MNLNAVINVALLHNTEKREKIHSQPHNLNAILFFHVTKIQAVNYYISLASVGEIA